MFSRSKYSIYFSVRLELCLFHVSNRFLLPCISLI